MTYKYTTRGVCASHIDVEINGNVVEKVTFYGGCNGNLKGITSLVEGLTYDEIKSKLGGIQCGGKSTSCPDQLVKAIEEAMKHEQASM